MAQPLTASMPEALILDAGYVITLDAVDPATGASVAGVVVADATVTATEQDGSTYAPPDPLPAILVHAPEAV